MEKFIIQIKEPDKDKFYDIGLKAKHATLESAQKELEDTIKYYRSDYKFRIEHVTCNVEVLSETTGINDLLVDKA